MNEQLQRIMRVHEVEYLVGFKKSQIYALAAKGEFPTPIKLSERSSGWLASEIFAWQQARISMSRHAA